MLENKYDNDEFFEKYSRFPRSVHGLSAAGEWHEFQKLLPDFSGKRVLDLGCGFGWHCIYAAENGAASVVGVDLSEKMLAEARARTKSPDITYIRCAIENYEYPAASFDVVISSLAFHYVPSFDDICEKISGCLIPGGDFVFTVEHPIFTAQGRQEWEYDANGYPSHWPVDKYFYEGERDSVFLDEIVIKYHKTMTTYMQALLNNGFEITGFCEPKPTPQMLEDNPEMMIELLRPMMMIISAKKRG